MKTILTHRTQAYALCIVMMVVSDMTLSFATPTNAGPPPENPGASHPPAASATDAGGGKGVNTAGGTNALYKTIVSQESGLYAIVETNREVVVLKNTAGETLWSTNVVEGLNTERDVSWRMRGQKIRGMKVVKEKYLEVRIGGGEAAIEIKTGKFIGSAVN